MSATKLMRDLKKLSTKKRAASNAWFFKTGKGEYGEGDLFIGVTVPKLRFVAKQYLQLPLSEIRKLLTSTYHEHRLVALFILVYRYKTADQKEQSQIVRFYLANRKHVNNWDLVDCSARDIVGAFYYERNRSPLYVFTRSKNMWERRIAVVATFYFIARGDFSDSLNIAGLLMKDREDLLHKAVGWMLREVGKKNIKVLMHFLDMHKHEMPRTTLRYAIERFPEPERKKYLKRTRKTEL